MIIIKGTIHAYKPPKHKVFVSFHNADDDYRKEFENEFSTDVEAFVSHSVQNDDIDPNGKTENTRRLIREGFISNSTVTIVLIGINTWKRKHVDWEFGYSLTKTSQSNRSGLIGILLPEYQSCPSWQCTTAYTEDGVQYTPCNIPPRLYDNVQISYANIYSYPTSHGELMTWIHEAFLARNKLHSLPNNTRSYFANNRTDNQNHWKS